MSPRLPTIAKAFNEKVKGYIATVDRTWSSTDRKLSGTRLIHPGKGRRGVAITILNLKGETAYEYDTSVSSLRRNIDVAIAIERLWGPVWLPNVKPKALKCFKCKAVENDQTRGRYRSTWLAAGATLCPKCSQKHG